MKLTESWLREWVNPKLTVEQLCEKLTMGGLEVEELSQLPDSRDYSIDIAITPNRGDCLSVRGVAREVAALTHTPLKSPIKKTTIKSIPNINDPLTVKVVDQVGCPYYVGRIIHGVKANLETPAWLKNRLEQSGAKSISPIVDVTNYVMLELGQPMHAFDLNKLHDTISVRQSKAGEKITLLDGSEKPLDNQTLVIADKDAPVAIAGVMGGVDSSVTLLTQDIFLESAYFAPAVVARQRQYYQLNSDSAYRFERGVDATIQVEAIERATQLILEICGGAAGPLIEVKSEKLPVQKTITLTAAAVEQLLGVTIPAQDIERYLTALQFDVAVQGKQWQVQVPTYRNDVTQPEDLIEEVARLYGYNNIPTTDLQAVLQARQPREQEQLHALRLALTHAGYHEIISYSFIDSKLQALLDPQETARALINPITSEMAVMRTNLWPGLINALLYNLNRQQQRVRLFEIGTCFVIREALQQVPRLAGLATGLAMPEQWGISAHAVDFYDIKGDLEQILHLPLTFKVETHPVLHPGQAAALYHGEQRIGIVGALNPQILQALDLLTKVYLFEIDLNSIQRPEKVQFKAISKFPEIRRDIALIVKETIPAKLFQDTIKDIAGDWLKDVFIFDVYQGKGVTPGHKSIALGLIIQHPTRTLVDDEVAEMMQRVITKLQVQFGAELRS